jgi:nicotinamidase-related amidase
LANTIVEVGCMKIVFSFFIVLVFASCNFATKGIKIAEYRNPKKALLILDMQNDFISKNAKMSVLATQIDPLVDVVNKIEKDNQIHGNYIVYIRNVFSKNDIGNLFRHNAAVENTDGINIDFRVNRYSQFIFDKNQPDAFSNKEFESFLIQNQINELTICGVFADQCVYWTSVGALNRGYKVCYVENGVAASNQKNIDSAVKSIREKGAQVVNYESKN